MVLSFSNFVIFSELPTTWTFDTHIKFTNFLMLFCAIITFFFDCSKSKLPNCVENFSEYRFNKYYFEISILFISSWCWVKRIEKPWNCDICGQFVNWFFGFRFVYCRFTNGYEPTNEETKRRLNKKKLIEESVHK